MAPDAPKLRPERDQTDESLRSERTNSDVVLEGALRGTEQNTADVIVEQARENADAVLEDARNKADTRLKAANSGTREVAAIHKAREIEDEVIEGERSAADEVLRKDREELARAMAKLLPLERTKTDRLLLTERARSDASLANRDDFLGMVSHDLRSLLGGIMLSAEELSDNAPETVHGKDAVKSAARILRYVARMNRLIGDLIDVVSIDAGKLAIHPERAEVGLLLSEGVDAFAQLAAETGVSLQAFPPAGALLAHFDHGRMIQVLANLITNALKFTPRLGAIGIHAELTGTDAHLWVTDTGAGIPPLMLESVFERFWQVGKNDKRGLGLGLYISRCIVDAHGGKIWAESTLGKGTTFHFTLPVAAPAQA
jgi:signal transduction histidine kinase